MPAPVFTQDQKLKAVELAAIHGISKTAESLNIKRETLKTWCYVNFRSEYSEFRTGKLSDWRMEFAAEMEDLQQNYASAETMALDRALEILQATGEEGDPKPDAKDVAALIKGMGAARASATTTATRARGEPDQIHEHQLNFAAVEQAAEAILAKYGPPPIEGEAEEIVEALPVPSEPDA
jgi:hypothetical protein